MPDFSRRSYQKELLDRDDIPFADIKVTMDELDNINTLLGGHQISIAGLKRLIGSAKTEAAVEICEIGCGDGNNLRVLKRWCEKHNIPATFTGIDINEHAIEFAKQKPENTGIHFICSDYRTAALRQNPHIIFSSLFCHHFTDEQLVDMLRWCYQNSTIGFFINDLQRHPFAYHSIKLLSAMFSKSYLVKNDGPLSVLRGFKKNEWERLLNLAEIDSYTIEWKWAFRWLIVVSKTDRANV